MNYKEAIQTILNTKSFQELYDVLDRLTAEPSPSMDESTVESRNWREIRFYAVEAYRKLYEKYSEKCPDELWPDVPLEKYEDSIITVREIVGCCKKAMVLESKILVGNNKELLKKEPITLTDFLGIVCSLDKKNDKNLVNKAKRTMQRDEKFIKPCRETKSGQSNLYNRQELVEYYLDAVKRLQGLPPINLAPEKTTFGFGQK